MSGGRRGKREEESLRGGEAPFFIKKFPLSFSRRGGQGVRLINNPLPHLAF